MMRCSGSMLLAALLLALSVSPLAADAGFWSPAGDVPARGATGFLFVLDRAALERQLAALPGADQAAASQQVVELPLPDGRRLALQVHDSAVMSPALARRYPQIRSFAGTAVADARIRGRFTLGPRGLRGQLMTPQGTLYIDPQVAPGNEGRGSGLHRVYRAAEQAPRQRPADHAEPALQRSTLASAATPGSLRTYRLAMATTGEYAQYHSGSTPDPVVVLAEVVNVVDRINGPFERDLGVRLQLIDASDQLIYTDPATDPFLNYSVSSMLYYNTGVLNDAVGAEAYDIGHVLGTYGGGQARIGVICGDDKGAGVTGLELPEGDAFTIDYVAHEVGHQLGANHIFNGSSGACAGARHAETAFEPGSGSTIMSYAGLCDADDLQMQVDDYFHAASIGEVQATLATSGGCAALGASSNQPPQVDAGSGGWTIPVSTPFELTGTASDADGDALLYRWEQMDLGAAGSPSAPDASAPLFRSFADSSSRSRVFPKMEDILAGTQTVGELLPTVSRTLNFQLSVRDAPLANLPPSWGQSAVSLNVSDEAGPFLVTAPAVGQQAVPGQNLKVRWDVAGTHLEPVACSEVSIALSVDGGQSFPQLLRKRTDNDGVQNVLVPEVSTQSARIRVRCLSQPFFAVSPGNFAISAAD